MGLSADATRQLLTRYRRVVLNSTLEHIYKYNKRTDINRNDKLGVLKGILENNTSFFDVDTDVIKHIKCYNRLRYNLLVRGHHKMLIAVDRILYDVQKLGVSGQ